MRLEVEDYLRLVENNNSICFFDLESLGFRGDYGSILVTSVKPYHGDPVTFTIKQPGNDKKLVRETKEELEKYDCWVTYYGKMFDIKMMNTRLLKWGYPPVAKRPHLDLYFSGKAHLNTARKSLGHLVGWLDTPEEKQYVNPDDWNQILNDPQGAVMQRMIARCESDVRITQDLYEKIKHVISDIKR